MSAGQELPASILKLVLLAAALSISLVFALAYGAHRGLLALSDGSVAISVRMILFAFAAYLAATLAGYLTRTRSRLAFVGVNTALLLAILAAFGLGLLRGHVQPGWFAFAAALVVFVQAGAYGFAAYRRRTLERLLSERLRSRAVADFEQQFGAHSLTYAAVPLGAVAGTFAGAALGWPPREIVRLCLLLALGIMLVGIAAFIVLGAVRMSRGSVREGDVTEPELSQAGRSYVQTLVPPIDPASAATVDHGIDGIVIATDVRRLYLLNQYQQAAVLIAVAMAWLYLLRGRAEQSWVAAALLAACVAFTQLPYLIGQQREHRLVLDRLKGVRREEVRERLAKYAPLVPKLESWAALTASGTLGGVGYKLLEKVFERVVLP
jgi:hypothetical protein